MKNITVSVDEKTHRMARIRAAELDTSVSALVRQCLRELVSGGTTVPANGATEAATGGARTPSLPERMTRQEARRLRIRMYEVLDEIWATHPGFRAVDHLSRDDIHDRGRARTEAARPPANPSDDQGDV